MQIAMIGLGRMGMNMAKRLLGGGHQVVVYNRTQSKTDQMVEEGAIGAYSLAEVVEKLSPPRTTWIMLPAGSAVDDHIAQLMALLSPMILLWTGATPIIRTISGVLISWQKRRSGLWIQASAVVYGV